MILYEYGYNHGERAEGIFCSAQCAENMYADNPHDYPRGCPTPLDEQESEELAADWKVCYGCGKPLIESGAMTNTQTK